MTTLIDLSQFSFHDASLVGASHQGSTIVLTVEYFDDNDAEASVLATISGVDSILRNNVPIDKFRMETSDGEIYRLVQEGQEMTLIVFWHKYAPPSKIMQTYKVYGKELSLQVVGSSSFKSPAL